MYINYLQSDGHEDQSGQNHNPSSDAIGQEKDCLSGFARSRGLLVSGKGLVVVSPREMQEAAL